MPADTLSSLPLSYASCSLGNTSNPNHNLPAKISAIGSAGFAGMELSMPDLVAFANQHLRQSQQSDTEQEITNRDYDDLCAAARVVKTICDAQGVEIMLMQPFANFEGWPADSAERKDAFERLEGWVRIMEAAGCKTLQIGSTDSPAEKIGMDRERFVTDLRTAADRLAEKDLRIAYENWCWSTHAPDWEDVWDICRKVDRVNFGLCLDTFQSAGGEWGDPTTSSGMLEGEGRSEKDVEKVWKESCQRLADTIPADRIFLLQISDAYKPRTAFEGQEIEGMRPRARWSSAWRPLPYEGYLPVVDFARAVLKTGFRGWFSYEIFDGGPDGKGREHELGPWVEAARKCQERLARDCAEGL